MLSVRAFLLFAWLACTAPLWGGLSESCWIVTKQKGGSGLEVLRSDKPVTYEKNATEYKLIDPTRFEAEPEKAPFFLDARLRPDGTLTATIHASERKWGYEYR